MSPQLRVRPGDPLIVDRWMDVAFAFLWGIYALWGVVTLVVGLPTIDINTPEWYSTLWAGMVGSLAAVACLSAISIFFQSHTSFIAKKKTERGAVIALAAFMAVYPILLFSSAFQGDLDRLSIAIYSLSLLVFTTYRVYVLNHRIRAFKTAVKEIANE